MDLLERKFNDNMQQIYFRAKKDLKYNATRFIQLVSEKGGLLAAKQLISKDGCTLRSVTLTTKFKEAATLISFIA